MRLTPEILTSLVRGYGGVEEDAIEFVVNVDSIRIWDESEADPPGGVSITMKSGHVDSLQIIREN